MHRSQSTTINYHVVSGRQFICVRGQRKRSSHLQLWTVSKTCLHAHRIRNTQLQIVFTPGNEHTLNKSKINCCNYSPAHPYNNYYTLDRGSSPLLAQITSQTHANHPSLLTTFIYTCSNSSWLFFFFFFFQVTDTLSRKKMLHAENPTCFCL